MLLLAFLLCGAGAAAAVFGTQGEGIAPDPDATGPQQVRLGVFVLASLATAAGVLDASSHSPSWTPAIVLLGGWSIARALTRRERPRAQVRLAPAAMALAVVAAALLARAG